MGEMAKVEPRWIGGIEPAPELLKATGTQILELECRQQPARLNSLIRFYRDDFKVRDECKKLRELASREGPVLFLGMGASYCSAISGSIHLQTNGRSSFSVDAGEWLHYGLPVWSEASNSILITASGESAELVELFKSGESRELSLISNNVDSTCWKLGKNNFPILAGPEYGNATKTYTNSTAAAIIVASEILGRGWESEADQVAEVFGKNLDAVFEMRDELEAFHSGAVNTEIIGRGAAYGGAIMSALCIREMTGHRASPHTGAGFRHGPNLDVDSSHLAIVFALGRSTNLGFKLAEECNRRGGKVLLVSAEDRKSNDRLLAVKIDPVPEPWEGITSLLVPQALTLAMCEKNGCRLPPRFQYGAMEQ